MMIDDVEFTSIHSTYRYLCCYLGKRMSQNCVMKLPVPKAAEKESPGPDGIPTKSSYTPYRPCGNTQTLPADCRMFNAIHVILVPIESAYVTS